jgi:alpha,alpha-trehalase
MPRYDGVRKFLLSRGIELPFGSPDDPPGRETVCGLGNRKNEIFRELLSRGGVERYEPAVAFAARLREAGFRTAAVSSSKNAGTVLAAAGLEGFFDVRVDGIVSERLGLKGKPAPEIFLEAAGQLGVDPRRTVLVEDALAGVEAGRRGAFGLVVGVDRGGRAAALREAGADVVVSDFSQARIGEEGPVPGSFEAIPRSALAALGDIEGRLKGKRPFVALDYDGTLTPIVERPEWAVLSEGTRETVRRLGRLCTVAVISGRDLPDVRGLVGIEEIFYAGSHGFDIAGPRETRVEARKGEEYVPLLDRIEGRLREALRDIRGSQLERKKYSLAVHYRRVARGDVPRVERIVDDALRDRPELRKGHGKEVFEVQPRIDWDKGRALLWLLEALGMDGPDVLPLYIGDDVTDEDAFRVLEDRGVGIFVTDGGPRETKARYVLVDPGEVRDFLEALAGFLQGGAA